MADATIKVTTSTQVVHIGSGTSLAAGAVNPASDISVALAGTGNLARYPRADVTLMIAPTASIALASANLFLYRRDINVDGTADEDTPATSNKQKFMGAFQASATTTANTTHYMTLVDVPLPGAGDCEFYVENGLGVNVPVGWTLKVTPKADVAATS